MDIKLLINSGNGELGNVIFDAGKGTIKSLFLRFITVVIY